MSDEPHNIANGSDPAEPARVSGEVEPAGDARRLPVPVPQPGVHPLEQVGPPLPAPVVAATGGFIAGVATFVVVRLLRRRRSSSVLGRLGAGRDRLEVAGSRSFLVDVHLLKR